MERSLLMDVGNSVKKYAQVLANVLQVDVDIADNKLFRVAGTGRFAENVDMLMAKQGTAFKKVLETKEPLVIDNPRIHEICLDCPGKEGCGEQFEISCPIILEGNVIGVIALASFEEGKRDYILQNLPNYMEFLENIADLIAAKVSEYKSFREQAFTLNLLTKLIDFIDDGVIVFNEDNTVLFVNKKAELMLEHNLKQMKYLQKVKKFSIYEVKNKNTISDVEYIANVKGRNVRLLGSTYPVSVGEKASGTVFVFQDIVSLHRKLFQDNRLENYNFDYLIGKDEYFLQVKERARRLSTTDRNILICGETGTGKEVFARAIHNESIKKNKPFITVMCSGTVDTILEEEIFGDSLQSPDGNRVSIGKIELTKGGTLFLDEIADLPLRLQGRLMEVIYKEKDANIRIIATTSKDLKSMVDKGEFRNDLFYSLEPFSITIPPVRGRRSDIKLLVNYFIEKYCTLENKQIRMDEDVYNTFMDYSWPGNVREIENVVSFIVHSNIDGKIISVKDLPESIQNKLTENTVGQYNIEKIEKQTILQALNAFGNSKETIKNVARELGISQATLYRKLKKYSISQGIHYK